MIIRLKLLLVVRNQNTDSKPGCTIQALTANCSSRGITTIPQTLDTKLAVLDASYNPIGGFQNDIFERYRGLLSLTLRRLNPKPYKISVESDIFTCMENLDSLDISESPFDVNTTEINWPTNLRYLSVASLLPFKFSKLDFSRLSLLEKLNASYHNLEEFPKLHLQAPVFWIDLYDNPQINLTAEQLAPFCTLSYLHLGSDRNNDKLGTKEYSCQCRRLEQWMLMHNILGFKISCNKSESRENDTCSVRNFSDFMMSQRSTCFARQPASWLWKWLLFLLLLFLLLPIIYISHRAYKSYKMKRKTSEDLSGTISVLDIVPMSPTAS